MATYGIYLAQSNLSGYSVCPNDKYCKAHCLYGSGQNMMDILSKKNIINASRIKKTKLFFENRQVFMELMVAEIKVKKARAESEGHFFSVRINCTSDINIRDFELNGVNICEIFPDTIFYDYTKMFNYLDNENKYNNYDLTFSYNGHNWALCEKALKDGFRVAVVFDKALPKKFHGYDVINGDGSDYRPAEPGGVIVGLKFKVTASSIKKGKFKMPETPFVVTAKNEYTEY
jgi:hypothetical protein